MKFILRGLFAALLVMAGLMFMRVIFELSNNEAITWAKPVMKITDVFCVPIAMMMFGGTQPSRVLVGTNAVLEPQTLVALFAILFLAFTLSMIIHAIEDRQS